MIPLLFFDPGSVTGWAGRNSNGATDFGHVRLAPVRATIGARVNALQDRLSELQSRFQPVEIGYEVPFHCEDKPAAGPPLFHYEAYFHGFCDRMNIPIRKVSVQQCKMAWGHGNMTKEQVIAAARREGYDVTCDHEADALGGLLHMIGVHNQMSLGLPGGRLRRKVTR